MLSCEVFAKLFLSLESEFTIITGEIVCWMLSGDMCLQSSCTWQCVTAKIAVGGCGLSWLAAMMALHMTIQLLA